MPKENSLNSHEVLYGSALDPSLMGPTFKKVNELKSIIY